MGGKKSFLSCVFGALILTIISISCKSTQEEYLWPVDGTTLHSTTYKLSIDDSSKILVDHQKYYSIIAPADSLITKQFDINYSPINSKAPDYFKETATQMVTNTSNPNISEYYKFNQSDVFFLGYSTGDEVQPYTIFEPPLKISPSFDESLGSNTSLEIESMCLMKTFDTKTNSFDKGFKTKLKVNNTGIINIKLDNGKLEKCYLRELILTRDAAISYGDNDLVVPEAILIKSKLLIDTKGYPIAEWSIKSEDNGNNAREEDKIKQRNFYIEFTKYYKR